MIGTKYGFVIFQFVAVFAACIGIFTNRPNLILYAIFMMVWELAWQIVAHLENRYDQR